ncbi:MAG: ABC-type multidrug transport system, ATPase and permease component [Acidimicrobiales bacterium]|nr:ABC-type multidrug transport system, ATPase and permease component [Acidimicrobiales bacterium]
MKRAYWRYLPTVFPYVRRYKGLAACSVLLLIASAVAVLAEPWPLALLVDGVLGDGRRPALVTDLVGTSDTALIVFAVVSGFLVTVVVHGLAMLSNYVNTKLSQQIALDFRSDLFQHCQRLSHAFHDEQQTGDFMYKINFEAHAVGEMSVALAPLAQSALTLIGMVWITIRIDTVLGLLALTIVPFIYYATGIYGRSVEPHQLRVRGLESHNLTVVNLAMSMLRVTSAFNRENYEHSLFKTQGQHAVDERVKLTVRQTAFSLSVALITAVGTATVLGVGAHHVLDGRLTVGALLVMMSYVHSMYEPLQSISATMASFQEHLMAIMFSRSLLDREPEIADAPDAVAIDRVTGHVRFEHVAFTYPGRETTLKDISFEVRPGTSVAIVGPTGAGKSTLLSMLPRFIDVHAGRIVLDGRDLRELTLFSLREQIAFVHQEPLLFPRSIAENIGYGRVGATMEEIVEAAKAANVHHVIQAMPEGYATVLGDRGARISGGERQRLSIARAFVKDAPILVLDEPTSSIDSRTEETILEALERLIRGRTTFIVAHRLSTVRRVDRVIVLEDGEIVEEGTHEELLRAGGLYSVLHALQRGDVRNGHEPPSGEQIEEVVAELTDPDADDGGDGNDGTTRHRRSPIDLLFAKARRS